MHPTLAGEWHPTRNADLTPGQVGSSSDRKVWWKCAKDPSHEWEAIVGNRARLGRGCQICNSGWTLQAIRLFVASLKDHLGTFTAAELYVIFQQSGLLDTQGQSKTFVRALTTGRFPKDELDKFVRGDPSLVDGFIADPDQRLHEPSLGSDKAREPDAAATVEIGSVEAAEPDRLPIVETKDALAACVDSVASFADAEAIAFLVACAVMKLWKHAFQDEEAALAQARAHSGAGYSAKVVQTFLGEHSKARELPIPEGYSFASNGRPLFPNLMQRLVASRILEKRRCGNWSGTGAGKTLSAILASRVADSLLTIICCPNSVVEGWRRALIAAFPDSDVATKTFRPTWNASSRHRYLILNYEAFQQPNSAQDSSALAQSEPDFIIVDEIHYAKQRVAEDMSLRRENVMALISISALRQPGVRVLALSATPVINNLQEGKSLVELVTGLAHDELEPRPSVANCMALHQRLATLGIRWMPRYDMAYEELHVPIDCSASIDEIRALGQAGSPLRLEHILTQARLPTIRQHVVRKTLIFTLYIQGIDRLLRDALEADGWKVGFYTGDDKSGLDGFIDGDVDVLIGTSAIGTGVDGLQQVCNRMIVNVLPWTHAEFEQLKGRLYRQGQRRDKVTMVLPLTFAEVNGERWSWCESKMQRLRFKKSIADAAVDGVVPEGHLRSPAQAYQDVLSWLERLEGGEPREIVRARIAVAIPEATSSEAPHRRSYGDFSVMNRSWNGSASSRTHKRLKSNPAEWVEYHSLYREARKDWAVVPFEELIRRYQKRSGYVIGDFGCGEAKLGAELSDRHTIHSFDHVAVNENVVVCDMARVPLDDCALDEALFSLSLMGSNFTDYIREAHRTLRLDGHLHIIEATSRFNDRAEFVRSLGRLGFDVVKVDDVWKFTWIHAIKVERMPDLGTTLKF